MSALGNLYFKIETLETLVSTLKKKGEKGISIDFSINDQTTQYGNNVSAYVSQTKEQREAKVDKFYTANGKIYWTDGKINVAEKTEQAKQPSKKEEVDDLPF